MEQYYGINCYDGPSVGTIQVPENIPHYYKVLPPGDPSGHKTILQVIYAGPDTQGTVPTPPAKQFQAPTYHPYVPIVWGDPKCAFGSDGICVTQGYAPGDIWYNVGDRTEHPSGTSPQTAVGVNLIAQGLALVMKG